MVACIYHFFPRVFYTSRTCNTQRQTSCACINMMLQTCVCWIACVTSGSLSPSLSLYLSFFLSFMLLKPCQFLVGTFDWGAMLFHDLDYGW